MKMLLVFVLSNFVLLSVYTQTMDEKSQFLSLHNQKLYAFKPGCPDTLSWVFIENDTILLRQSYLQSNDYRLDRFTYTLGESTNKDSLYLFFHKEEVAFGQDSVFQEMVRMGKSQDWLQRVWVKPEKDALLFAYQKSPFEGRPGHEKVFTTVRLYVSEEVFFSNIIENNETEGKFILPKGFTGRGLIALNQADGLEPEYDTKGIPIYRIGNDGLLSTQHPENPFMIAKGTYRFYFYDNTKSQQLTPIPILSNDCRYVLANEFTLNGTLSDEKYKLDEVYVLVSRYNPAPNVIDEAFGKPTLGNVKVIQVDTLREFLLR